MSAHSSSRRRAYGRRQKDLRDRRDPRVEVDLEGPAGWPRGDAWDRPAGAPGSHDLHQRSGGPA